MTVKWYYSRDKANAVTLLQVMMNGEHFANTFHWDALGKK